MFAGAKKISVLIVDDHAGMRDGIRAVINAQPDMEVVGEADDGEKAILQFKQHRPDVSLVDFNLPIISGDNVIAAIHQEAPTARCLVISAVNDDCAIKRAFCAGALGYLHKDTMRRELLPAIRKIYTGNKYISKDIAARLKEITDEGGDSMGVPKDLET
jgi:DNA-binding NarL/FixJ family response regulator